MKLTHDDHVWNAGAWIGASDEPLEPGEPVSREGLSEQLGNTIADAEDVEQIAQLIEQISEERR